MQQVYSNSVCNIAAADSGDSQGGLFRKRDPELIQLIQVRTKLVNDSFSDILMWNLKFTSNLMIDSPLHKRGWVVQETLLTPRVLHFGRGQIYWKCREISASETFPLGGPRYYYGFNIGDVLHLPDFVSSAEDVLMPYNIYKSWNSVLARYTRCEITFPQDKLVALSGVVQLFQAKTGDEYLAGIWRSRSSESLLWTCELDSDDAIIPKLIPYRAPTWSWACQDCVISTNDDEGEDLFEIGKVQITTIGDVETGQTSAVVKGPALLATINLENENIEMNGIFGSIYIDLSFKLETEDDIYALVVMSYLNQPQESSGNVSDQEDTDRDSSDNKGYKEEQEEPDSEDERDSNTASDYAHSHTRNGLLNSELSSYNDGQDLNSMHELDSKNSDQDSSNNEIDSTSSDNSWEANLNTTTYTTGLMLQQVDGDDEVYRRIGVFALWGKEYNERAGLSIDENGKTTWKEPFTFKEFKII